MTGAVKDMSSFDTWLNFFMIDNNISMAETVYEGIVDGKMKHATYREFFGNAPAMNPNASLIRGSVCGIKVEEIEDPLMQKIRWLDKLVDELAKGKPLNKVLR